MTSSYWHSNYRDGQQKPYPFTFVIDMKDELMVGKLGAMSRENNYYTKGISYYISDDDEFTAGNPDNQERFDWHPSPTTLLHQLHSYISLQYISNLPKQYSTQ